MNKLILATSNKGKIKELSELLKPIQCINQNNLGITNAEETGLSFVENALIKARHASSCSGLPALADDSGLVVPALNGEPGIYSARYAGVHATDEENLHLLLQNMSHLQEEQRDAYFYCAIAVVLHEKDPTPMIATGAFTGRISQEPSGKEGFGYDPIFYVPKHHCTAAQLPPAIKNTISHRAQALKQLHQLLVTHHEK